MRISVIVPIYNAEAYLEECLDSILIQEEVDEILCIDDGSEDASFEILKSYAKRFERIQLFTHPGKVNRRAAATRNVGIRHASGDYIAFMDADDYYYPKRFRLACQFLQENSDIEFIYQPVFTPGEDNPTLRLDGVNVQQLFLGLPGQALIESWIVKASVFDKIGLFDESLYQCEDTDMLRKLLLHCKCSDALHASPPVAYRRIHERSTVQNKQEQKMYRLLLEKKWIFSRKGVHFWTKIRLFQKYLVIKYESRDWSLPRKVIAYPFLIVPTLLSLLRKS